MRNETTLNALTVELQRNCGDILAAAKSVGVSLIFVNQWRKDDKKVDETLMEAERVGVQGLYSAAVQRAVQGVEEDVYYKGEVVGQKTNYSDSLLGKLLDAKLDDFKKSGDTPLQVNVNVANIMPRAANYSDWLAMKDQTMNRALPAPDADREASLEAISRLMCEPSDIIEAEYAEIVPAMQGINL